MNMFKFLQKSLHWAVIVTTAFIVSGCGSRNQESAQNTNSPVVAGAHIIPVEAAQIYRKDIAVTKTYTGSLEGEEQANIVAKISERIVAIKARTGESVTAGQDIILLDKSGASSQYYQAEANYKNSEKNLQRMKALLSEGAISQQLFDGTQTVFDIAKANFDAARSAVELTTPIPGVVTALNVNIGDLAAPGAVLGTIAHIRRMKVIFNISESDVMNLAIGHKVEVYSETNPEALVKGQVIQLSKSADIRSRSFEVKALFPNTADFWYKPGMFCKVNVNLSQRKKTLVAPNVAVLSDGISSRVYVVRNGRAFQQLVQPGITDGLDTEILQGLNEGEMVVTVGATNLRDSSFVNITAQ